MAHQSRHRNSCSVASAANGIGIAIAAAEVVAQVFKVQKVLPVGQENIYSASAVIKVCRISGGRFICSIDGDRLGQTSASWAQGGAYR